MSLINAELKQWLDLVTHSAVISFIPSLKDYPWIKDDEHLKRVNCYRKRVGQTKLVFSDDDMAELILLRSK